MKENFLGACFRSAAMKTASFFGGVWHDLRLIGEGALHMDAAPFRLQQAFRRDSATFAVEAGVAVVEDIAFEAGLAIAAATAAEKIIDREEPAKPAEMVFGMAEGIAGSNIAAVHAAMNIVGDLEQAGAAWESVHPHHVQSHRLGAAAHERAGGEAALDWRTQQEISAFIARTPLYTIFMR